MPHSSRRIENEQQGFWQAVRALPTSARLFIGLFVSALLSWVAFPLLANLLTLGEYGVRDLNNILVNIIAIFLLMVINYFSYKLHRVMEVAIVLFVPFLIWRVFETILHMRAGAWHDYLAFMSWFINVLVAALPLLNAALFLKFKQNAGLE